MTDPDRTASLMSPAKLAQLKPRPTASGSAWLDQMAADAGQLHVVKLGELAREFAGLGRADFSPVLRELQALDKQLPTLDFGLLQARSWWARTTGKGRDAAAQFAAQVEAIVGACEALAGEVATWQKTQRAATQAAERSLLEWEVEWLAIDKVIDQGSRWLQDMRTQLKARHAAAADAQAQQQVKDDAARCEILVVRLKALRALSTAAQQAHEQAQSLAPRRAAVIQLLTQALPADAKAWDARLSTLAGADAGGPALGLDGPMGLHKSLQQQVARALAAAARLREGEAALAQRLAELGQQAAAVAGQVA